jgi:hypothetical protein
MIKVLKKLRKEKGLYLIVTELNAKAADIITEYEKDVIDYRLEERLIELSDHVDNDMVIKCLKDFLIESVFTHYVDMVSILNYIHTIRETIRVAKAHPSHSKFLFVTEFKNYVADKLDSDSDVEKKENFVNTTFKLDLLKKNNLKFVEQVIFESLNTMYGENIVALKPKKVDVSLKNHEKLISINMVFADQTK